MSLTLKYLGEGNFRAIYPAKCADMAAGDIAAWSKVEVRSAKSHRQFFAAVHDAWLNLPEHLSDEFPNAEILRKFALIKAGYCDADKVVCANNAEALNLVSAMRRRDAYAVINIEGRVVTIYTAHSQSIPSMGRKLFAESKEAVFRVLSDLLGTEITERVDLAA